MSRRHPRQPGCRRGRSLRGAQKAGQVQRRALRKSADDRDAGAENRGQEARLREEEREEGEEGESRVRGLHESPDCRFLNHITYNHSRIQDCQMLYVPMNVPQHIYSKSPRPHHFRGDPPIIFVFLSPRILSESLIH